MAIIDEIEVVIKVDDVALTEYDDSSEDDEDNTSQDKKVVKYVEAVAGKPFSIQFQVSEKFVFGHVDYLCFETTLDGKWMKSPVIWSGKNKKRNNRRKVVSTTHYYQNGQWWEQQFRFAEISFGNPESNIKPHRADYEKLGQIKVAVWRYRENKRCGKTNAEVTLKAPSGLDDSIPEKVVQKEAVTIRSSLGPKQRASPTDIIPGKKLDTAPIATFIFKYRSIEGLKHLLIIPRTPSPVPPGDLKVADMTVQELRNTVQELKDLVGRQEAQMSAVLRVKKEEEQKFPVKKEGVKRERDREDDESFSKRARPGDGTAIDIGDQDNELEEVVITSVKSNNKPGKDTEIIDLT